MFKIFIQKSTFTLALCLGIVLNSQASRNQWLDIPSSSTTKSMDRNKVYPEKYRTLTLNNEVLKTVLNSAPKANQINTSVANKVTIEIPMPYGSFETFQIVETPIMEEELASKYSNIKTYSGQSIDNPQNTIKMDIGPFGFHAMVLSKDGKYFIDPISNYTTTQYMSYYRRDLPTWANTFSCNTVSDEQFEADTKSRLEEYYAKGNVAVVQLRTYRLALACTVEYASAATGLSTPTKEQVLAKMVTSMNRVNGVYETEVAVTMVMVNNTDTLIYLPGTTDPYTNSDGGAMLTQNQTTCNARIGSANYDIGHVFSTGGGGIAGLGVVCTSTKAQGVTGSPSPVGDAFDIDYVAHEMGHQFAGNHTFNSVTGSCGGGNRNATTAYEPGSGTTIMAYAGICGADDIALHSDPYFHAISLDEINAFINSGSGNSCPVKTTTTNNPPVVNAGSNYTIPLSTAFKLTGSATDPDGDNLTYSWEQMDLGTGGAPNSATGNAPLVRFFPPTTTPVRTFPKLSDILTNTQVKGERLPSYARNMKFRLVARDNKPMAGATGKAEMNVTVSGTAGPFVITTFNTIDSAYVGTSETITWNVANTDISPVNCSLVRILLSTDGGQTFPIILADSTANDGNESVIIPNNVSNTCRIKIEAIGNIFFDISNVSFRIIQPLAPDFIISVINNSTSGVCVSDTVYYDVKFNAVLNCNGVVDLSTTNLPSGATVIFSKSSANIGETVVAKVVTTGLTAGTKNFNIVGTSGVITHTNPASFTVLASVTGTAAFTSPINGQINVNPNNALTWTAIANATAYEVTIATDSNFVNIVFDSTAIGASSLSMVPVGLPLGTQLYAKIFAKNKCGNGPVAKFISYTTASLPNAPSNLLKLSQTVSSITLKWTDNASNETGFRVERSTNNDTSFTQISGNLGANTSLFVSTSLTAGDTYYYRVRAVNAVGFSSYSNVLQVLFTVGIEQQLAFKNIDIFPNPSENVFNLLVQDEYVGETTFSVTDELGRVVFTEKMMKENEDLNAKIDLSNVSNGIYFIKVQSDQKTTTKKVVKMN